MSRCLAIFHKQLGDLVLLEPTLKRLSRASGSTVDLITRSGFQPLISLMPQVEFRRTPRRRIYDALWCFDDRMKSAFHAFLSRARQKHLLINPGAPIQWYHSKIFPKIVVPNATHWHRKTGYSQAIVTGNIIGMPFPRLKFLPEEPVIEAVVKLWTANVSV
jgi:hypothetical protein